MKITKYLHSCLLVEEKETSVLIDPGIFTYQEHVLKPETLNSLDYIAITHEHPDHYHLPFIKKLVARFPDVTILSNPTIVALLQQEGITATTENHQDITMESVPHEQLWDAQAPENVMLHVFNKLTHPGDSHHFETTRDILALPIQAPWGSTYDAVQLALKLNPKMIIPIHDWMWKDDVRQKMYERLHGFFKEKGIDFKAVETGETVEL